jgi:hypothetical protein
MTQSAHSKALCALKTFQGGAIKREDIVLHADHDPAVVLRLVVQILSKVPTFVSVPPISEVSDCVCFWHFSDMPPVQTNVRYRGKADMTRTGRYVG